MGGQRVAASESSRVTSRFSQTFSLDDSVDVDSFTATLNNGVLVVSAPKDLAKLEENVRKIPITSLEDILAETDEEMDDHRRTTILLTKRTRKEKKSIFQRSHQVLPIMTPLTIPMTNRNNQGKTHSEMRF